MIRVHIAVDQTAVRWAVAASFRNDPEIEIVAETTEGREGAAMGSEAFPDVAILSDSRHEPPEHSVDRYRAAAPTAKIVLLLSSLRAVDLINRAGADAAVDAVDGLGALKEAVQSVVAG